MKKEYFILAAIIIALSAYLVFHKENKTNYTLPGVPEISGSNITSLDVNTGKKVISFTKKYDKWFIGDKKYPADPAKIKSMIEVMEKLNLSALVSKSDDLTRYKLDQKNRIEAVVKNDSKILRKIEIGKTAPTYRHTFVQIGNDKNIYYAKGNFRSDFDNDLDGFRNKEILSFDGKTINRIMIKKGEKQNEFVLKTKTGQVEEKEAVSHNDAQSNKDAQLKGKIKAKAPVKPAGMKLAGTEKWESKDGSSFNSDDIKNLISRLADFKCTHYTDNDSKDAYKARVPLCTIIIEAKKEQAKKENGKKKISLSLYAKNKNGNYPGICSENRYPFLLDSYEGDNIIAKVDTLLGIKKVKKKK